MTNLNKLPLESHYSGDNSERFWEIVNKLPKSKWYAAVSLGIALQNLEYQVLKHIQHDNPKAIKEEKKKDK